MYLFFRNSYSEERAADWNGMTFGCYLTLYRPTCASLPRPWPCYVLQKWSAVFLDQYFAVDKVALPAGVQLFSASYLCYHMYSVHVYIVFFSTYWVIVVPTSFGFLQMANYDSYVGECIHLVNKTVHASIVTYTSKISNVKIAWYGSGRFEDYHQIKKLHSSSTYIQYWHCLLCIMFFKCFLWEKRLWENPKE